MIWKCGNQKVHQVQRFHQKMIWKCGNQKVHQVQRFHQKMIWKCGNQDDVVDGLLSFLPGTHTWRTGVSIGLGCTCWTNGCNVNFQSEHLTFNLIIRNGRGDMSFQKGEEKPAFWSSWNSLGTWFYNIKYDARFLANHACATSLGNFREHGPMGVQGQTHQQLRLVVYHGIFFSGGCMVG